MCMGVLPKCRCVCVLPECLVFERARGCVRSPLELELQTMASHHLGARSQAQVLWKTS